MKKPKLPRQTWTRSPATKVKESKKNYHRQKKVSWEKEIIPQNQFRYCPLCSAELFQKKVDLHQRLVCPVCGYVYYNNPIPACAVILEKDKKILLCQRKYPPYPDGWTLPSGFLEAEETPNSARSERPKRRLIWKLRLKISLGYIRLEMTPVPMSL